VERTKLSVSVTFDPWLNASPVFIPEEIAPQTERFGLLLDDIVISMTGTKYKRDYGNALSCGRRMVVSFVNQRVARLRCTEKILPKFMLYWLQTPTFRGFFFSGETTLVQDSK
jgi:type I restriction enzyme S subunit